MELFENKLIIEDFSFINDLSNNVSSIVSFYMNIAADHFIEQIYCWLEDKHFKSPSNNVVVTYISFSS